MLEYLRSMQSLTHKYVRLHLYDRAVGVAYIWLVVACQSSRYYAGGASFKAGETAGEIAANTKKTRRRKHQEDKRRINRVR